MKNLILISTCGVLALSSCSNAGTGATIGAIVGVGAGAAIGGGEGAIIGGAVGAVSGAIIGSALDDSDRERLQSESPDTLKKVDENKKLSKQDIINMSRAGISDQVIIDQIHASKSKFSLSSDEIIDLKNQGVSQSVINAMIKTKTQ
jgi:outer membrane lipoprotein SlyB